MANTTFFNGGVGDSSHEVMNYKTGVTGDTSKSITSMATDTSQKNFTLSTGVSSAQNAQHISSMGKMGNDLRNLNTMRGGSKGFKGFVAEHMQAAEATGKGKHTVVLDDNGIADLKYTGKNGHEYYQQMKFGYENGNIDFAKYKGQTVIVDKGNPSFKKWKAEGRKYNVNVVESEITKKEAEELAKWMQKETALTGAKKAVVVPRVAAAHRAGLNAAKTGAMFGAGMSIGANAVDVINGDKELGDAAVDVAKDTAVAYGSAYVAGAAGSMIASTSVGTAAIGAASSAAAAVSSTAVGGAVIGAGTAAAGAVGAAGAAATGAVVGAVGTAAGAIGAGVTAAGSAAVAATAGTVVGGAVASGVAATAAAGAATAAAGAAIGAAAVAAAPVVAVGAALGAGYKILSSLFDD
ncbi:MAG: hypothetical protein MSS66_07665 [Selenomonadaceae bacterium]|nr:hypothetical protein [Selenomonadaceae bacterium]